MVQRILKARWCQYDTKDIKRQVVPVIDVVSVVIWQVTSWHHLTVGVLYAILALPGLVPSWYRLTFGVVCALIAPPGPHRANVVS